MIKSRAFSLIELMVVIAIVSLLATVAMPAYESYIQKAKVAKARVFVDAVISNAKQFYSTNGRFPQNMTEMGLPGDAGVATPVPTNSADYLNGSVAAIAIDVGNQQPRCSSMQMTADISNFSGGDYFTEGGDVLHLIYQFTDVDGILVENCQYMPPFSQQDVSDGDLTKNVSFNVSNCMNVATPEGMAAATEYSNYINTNCM